nr:uncharacterized protein LOC122321932 [Drosophila bipectinata]
MNLLYGTPKAMHIKSSMCVIMHGKFYSKYIYKEFDEHAKLEAVKKKVNSRHIDENYKRCIEVKNQALERTMCTSRACGTSVICLFLMKQNPRSMESALLMTAQQVTYRRRRNENRMNLRRSYRKQ